MYNDLFSIGGLTVHGYGLMIGLGFLAAIWLGQYRAKKFGLNPDDIINIGMLVIVLGFAGGKLLHIITNFELFLDKPLEVLGSEGFVVYGGLLTGVLSGAVYCKIKKLDFLAHFDLVMPSVALAQGFGRIGCFLAGCCYGRATDSFLGVTFPRGSLAPAGVKVLPTQLFSSIGDFALTLVLIWYAKRAKKGNTGAMYFVLYGIGRFIVEYFRDDERGTIGIFSTSQFISIFFVLAGVLIFIWNARRKISTTDVE